MTMGGEENFNNGPSFSADFLEQEARLGSEVYHAFIYRALFSGNVNEALAYYYRALEKDAKIDIKETLRFVIQGLITRPEPLNTPGMGWGGMLEDEDEAFDPNTINIDSIYDFIAQAHIDFDLENEYQPLVEHALSKGDFLYSDKGKRGYYVLETFAKERSIPLDFSTPEVASALQENLEKVCLGRFSDNLEHPVGNPSSVDRVVEMVQQTLAFAQEKNIHLDAKLAFDAEMNKLTSLKDNPGYGAKLAELQEVAQRVGISLE